MVSIDTRHAAVMGQAVEAGAWIINDVTALTGDPKSARVAAKSGAAIVLMHMLGEPQTMQADPRYADVTCDLLDYFAARLAALYFRPDASCNRAPGRKPPAVTTCCARSLLTLVVGRGTTGCRVSPIGRNARAAPAVRASHESRAQHASIHESHANPQSRRG